MPATALLCLDRQPGEASVVAKHHGGEWGYVSLLTAAPPGDRNL